MIDRRMAASPVDGLIVYPEGMCSITVPMTHSHATARIPCRAPDPLCSAAGHRSTARTSLPLKRGMLAYAYSRKIPVQVRTTPLCHMLLQRFHASASS